jgi:hypothetical protein
MVCSSEVYRPLRGLQFVWDGLPGVRCAHPGLYAAVRSADWFRDRAHRLLLIPQMMSQVYQCLCEPWVTGEKICGSRGAVTNKHSTRQSAHSKMEVSRRNSGGEPSESRFLRPGKSLNECWCWPACWASCMSRRCSNSWRRYSSCSTNARSCLSWSSSCSNSSRPVHSSLPCYNTPCSRSSNSAASRY